MGIALIRDPDGYSIEILPKNDMASRYTIHQSVPQDATRETLVS